MTTVKGLAGAGGQAILKAVRFERPELIVKKRQVETPKAEVERFEAIRRDYVLELRTLHAEVLSSIGREAADIIKAYETIASDDYFFKKPLAEAIKDGVNPDWTLELEKQKTVERFSHIEDAYLRDRAVDISNVCDELIRRMNGIPAQKPAYQREAFLVVAHDLTPEDTVRFDKKLLGGFVTEKGGTTSHAVILAKALGIPAVVGATGIVGKVADGQAVFINGDEGYVIIDPDEQVLISFERTHARQRNVEKLYAEAARMPASTKDGCGIRVCVNSGDEDSIAAFDPSTCDGIGLFRTEFLFMRGSDYPTESQQYDAYRSIAEQSSGKEVVIRTLDIGGDKQLGYMNLPQEDNPFLGLRAIRISLNRPEIFLTQLRAILRASVYGRLKIMFPMIVTCEELIQAKEMLEQAKQTLRSEGLPFDEAIPVGIMIETPASVLISDLLARQADFFSIGTNDLIQYTTATDRMNQGVQYLYDPFNLSVLRAIRHTIAVAGKAGIDVAMCGEMASDERLLPLLLGFGLSEISIAPSQVGRVKYRISQYSLRDLKKMAEKIMAQDSIAAVKAGLADIFGGA